MVDHRAETGWKMPDTSKLRKWLYGIVLTASPLAVAYGIVEADKIGLWVAFGGAVLGVTNLLALVNVNTPKDGEA